MAMKMTFLGTSCMVPTKERNATAIFLEYEEEGILFDCGEGTQRQMNIAGINRNKVTKIFISHWHADHTAGLLGLIQTISNKDIEKTVHLYGPEGTEEFFDHLLHSSAFDAQINIKVHEINPKGKECILETKKYKVYAANLDHTVPCLGYVFLEKDKHKILMSKINALKLNPGPWLNKLAQNEEVEVEGHTLHPDEYTSLVPGKQLSIVLDTAYCENYTLLAQNADVLVSEAAYLDNLAEKAEAFKHMTAKQAANIASQYNVKALYLTHFSQRYKSLEEFETEAQNIFPNTVCAFDFLSVNIK